MCASHVFYTIPSLIILYYSNGIPDVSNAFRICNDQAIFICMGFFSVRTSAVLSVSECMCEFYECRQNGTMNSSGRRRRQKQQKKKIANGKLYISATTSRTNSLANESYQVNSSSIESWTNCISIGFMYGCVCAGFVLAFRPSYPISKKVSFSMLSCCFFFRRSLPN